MTTTRAIAIAAALTLSASTAFAADGIVMTQQLTRGNGEVTTMNTQITKTKMKAEYAGPGGTQQIVIFDGAQQVLYRIDPAAKTVTVTTKADLEQMSGAMTAMMAQMQAQMANMPPAQRAQMEALMRGRMGGAAPAPPKTEYRKTGSATVGRWSCDTYEGFRNGQKTSEICTVAPSALGFTAADFEVSHQLAEFFSSMVGGLTDQVASIGRPEVEGFAGLPIRSTTFVNGQQIKTEVVRAGRQNIPDGVFEIPAGFTQQAMPGVGRGARGR
jgi:hypothetical protein